ncbi:MAG: hypothetical protein BMS9Abin23_0099 [Thermodesulfobacteriota bacterium]|nr:MAG: hypothetical protein BMS9Abin23_0099 [Thermodesulfobacteriota bacterium]
MVFRRFYRPMVIAATLAAVLFLYETGQSHGGDKVKPGYSKVTPPSLYGSVLMNRTTKGTEAGPVVFPHWAHRKDYTCSVCHTELGFAMKAGSADIRQDDIEAGEYCGKCHNGTEAFGPDQCIRCHSYGLSVKNNSEIEDSLKDLPRDIFGNGVNWVKAEEEGKITPRSSIEGKGKLKVLDKDVIIPVTKFTPHPPDVLFPHKPHTTQIDCASCHPKPFENKKGGNPDMNMMKIISGQYCGVCHGRVSFPLEDCFRCHSQPAPLPDELKPDKKGDKKAPVKKEEKKKKKKKPRTTLF